MCHLPLKQNHLGICGALGAGKSKLVDLKLRLTTQTSGKAMINGFPLTTAKAQSFNLWWPMSHGMFIYLIEDTMRKEYYVWKRFEGGTCAVVKAADTAELHGLIESLPYGYQTRLGDRRVRRSLRTTTAKLCRTCTSTQSGCNDFG